MASRLNQALGIITTPRRAGMIAPMRPDRYLEMAAAMRRGGMGMIVRKPRLQVQAQQARLVATVESETGTFLPT